MVLPRSVCFLFLGLQFYILHLLSFLHLWLQYCRGKVIPTRNIHEECSQFIELLTVLLGTFQAVADISPVLFIALLVFPQAGRTLKQMRAVCMHAKSLQLYPTLWDPVYCSLPASYVQGILQARILEWVAKLFSKGSSWPRNWSHISYISCIGRQVLNH